MFIGVIQAVGKVNQKYIENNKIYIDIQAERFSAKIETGTEVNINGLSFIVNEVGNNHFKGTNKLSIIVNNNVVNLKAGSYVNLEKEVQPYRYEGSHVISGNINNIGKILEIKDLEDEKQLSIKTIKDLNDYFKKNKSIAINGISLKINELEEDKIVVKVNNGIWKNTNLKYLQKGDKVNIETDIVGRYIGKVMEKQYEVKEKKQIIKEDLLKEDGFIK